MAEIYSEFSGISLGEGDEASWFSSPSFRIESEDVLVRRAICNIGELSPNTMRTFDLENLKILVALQQGKVYAVSNRCTHDGESLINGSLGKRRVRCRQCGSSFSLVTGDIENFPAMNPLPCYRVEVEEEQIFVIMPERNILSEVRAVMIPKIHHKTSETFAIIGGGPAAAVCIESLRLLGFTGKLVVFMKENELPYNRTVLSKDLAVDASHILLRNQTFYEQMDVEIFLGVEVVRLNVEDKTLMRNDGGVTSFDKVFIATGCQAKRLSAEVSGVLDASGIFYLRTIDDVATIRAELNEELDLVVVGASFLGMEVAATCLPHVKSLTVISDVQYPFQNTFGSSLGKRLLKLYNNMGIVMKMNCNIVKLAMNPDTLETTGVILHDETLVPTQMAIVCIGGTFSTEFLGNSGVTLTPQGAVLVDQHLQTNVPFVYAGGDIAYAPLHPFFNTSTPGGHFQIAQTHGRLAAINMLGIATSVKIIPFITVSLGEITLQYVGWIRNKENVVFEGSLKNLKFAAYYLDGDHVTAIVTCGLPSLASKFAETIEMGKYVQSDTLRDHMWCKRMFMCCVHERDEDYHLDLDKLKEMSLVF